MPGGLLPVNQRNALPEQADAGTVAQGASGNPVDPWLVAVTENGTNTVVRPGHAATMSVRVNVVAGSVVIGGIVTVVNAGTFAVQDSQVIADNTPFTDGTSNLFMAGWIFDEVAGAPLTENDAAAARVDSKRAVVGVIEDATTRGQRASVSAAGALKVDGSAVTQPVSGTVAISGTVTVANGGTFAVQDNQVIADNTPFTDGTSNLFMAGWIFDEVAGTPLTENDAAAARVDSKRAVVGVIEDATTRGRRAGVVSETGTNAVNALAVGGGTPHDSVDAGNPLKVGMKAVAHGSNPAAVAAGDRTNAYANRAGVPFVIGGHPNIVCLEAAYAAAQTNTAVVTVAAGLKIVVTAIEVVCSNANSVNVGVRVGFGTASTPTTTGVVLTHPGIAPGSGVVLGNGAGILGVGADDEDLRITCDVPTGGSVRVRVSYFTIES